MLILLCSNARYNLDSSQLLAEAAKLHFLILTSYNFDYMQCGFKMFTRSAARKLFINIRLKR